VIGSAASIGALLWSGANIAENQISSVVGVILNNTLRFDIVTAPVALLFGLWWPAWSWRWGLVISYCAIVVAALMAATLVHCAFGCESRFGLTWEVLVGTLALPAVPCAAAAVGAAVGLRTDRE
jgi:hypothetical protein